MADRRTALQVSIAIAAFTWLAALIDLPWPLRLIPGAALVLYLPGWLLTRSFVNLTADPFERAALSLGFSIAIGVMVGLAMHAVGTMRQPVWLGVEAAIVIALAWWSPVDSPGGDGQSGQPTLLGGNAGIVAAVGQNARALGLAALMVCGAILVAQFGERLSPPFRATEFWMLPSKDVQRGPLTIGLRNAESKSETFDIELMKGNETLARWVGFSVAANDIREFTVQLDAQCCHGERVEARLYKSSEPQRVVRRVWLADSTE